MNHYFCSCCPWCTRDASLHGSSRCFLCLRTELFSLLCPGTQPLGGAERSSLKVGEGLLFQLLHTSFHDPQLSLLCPESMKSLKKMPHLLWDLIPLDIEAQIPLHKCPKAWRGGSRPHSLPSGCHHNKNLLSSSSVAKQKSQNLAWLYGVGWGESLPLFVVSGSLLSGHHAPYTYENGGLTLELRNASIFCATSERFRLECM